MPSSAAGAGPWAAGREGWGCRSEAAQVSGNRGAYGQRSRFGSTCGCLPGNPRARLAGLQGRCLSFLGARVTEHVRGHAGPSWSRVRGVSSPGAA